MEGASDRTATCSDLLMDRNLSGDLSTNTKHAESPSASKIEGLTPILNF